MQYIAYILAATQVKTVNRKPAGQFCVAKIRNVLLRSKVTSTFSLLVFLSKLIFLKKQSKIDGTETTTRRERRPFSTFIQSVYVSSVYISCMRKWIGQAGRQARSLLPLRST